MKFKFGLDFWNHVNGWLLVLPAVFMISLFTHFPIASTLFHSLFSTGTVSRPAEFIGLENYAYLLEDEIFWKVLFNNFVYSLCTVPVSMAMALGMAILVNRKIKGRSLIRMSFFTPTVLPMIAVANIWLFFYTPEYGLFDQIFAAFGGDSHNWLGNPDTALSCLIVMVIWKESGFFMVFYLAALQQLSPELREAGMVEGAGSWYYFRRVTFPLLMPTTLFIGINAVVNSFKLVDHLVIMTKGGPDNASSLLLYYIYENAFSFWDSSYAATLTAVLVLILAVITVIQFTTVEKRIHYQ
ncbi:carbohydrate ABC transporter permease [Desulfospira joergensenii]|uniref:carbohydrate ABC transporter permease n=1 Tax=Desulfospira joergensenii TaxID=53329 RepID=UPI0003B6166F|nr:sugar ABC transporter permease [Desulfospira joergensenii]